MRAEYDFSKGRRGAVIPQKGKSRISIFIDNSVLAEFRARAERAFSEIIPAQLALQDDKYGRHPWKYLFVLTLLPPQLEHRRGMSIDCFPGDLQTRL